MHILEGIQSSAKQVKANKRLFTHNEGRVIWQGLRRGDKADLDAGDLLLVLSTKSLREVFSSDYKY